MWLFGVGAGAAGAVDVFTSTARWPGWRVVSMPWILLLLLHRGLGRLQRVLRRGGTAQSRLDGGPQLLGNLRVLGAQVVTGAALGGADGLDPDLELGLSGDLLVLDRGGG